jgi:tRNA (cytidine/uridine-2'-O-)-methyltransferase
MTSIHDPPRSHWPRPYWPILRIALFEPDIPQNTGTIVRLAACLGLEAHLIEPAGFPVSDRAFRRAGMDYLDDVNLTRHQSWEVFARWCADEKLRLVLFTTKAGRSYLVLLTCSFAI